MAVPALSAANKTLLALLHDLAALPVLSAVVRLARNAALSFVSGSIEPPTVAAALGYFCAFRTAVQFFAKSSVFCIFIVKRIFLFHVRVE